MIDKVANGKIILGQRPRCEALVGAVEEREQALVAHQLGNLGPLLFSGINSSRVVRVSMENDNVAFGSILQRRHHSLKIQHVGLLVKVGIVLDGQLDVIETLPVDGPCRVGDVNGWGRFGEKLGEKGTAEMDSPGPGNGLKGGNYSSP